MANKFTQTWATQTEIGRQFKLSAVAVGKILTQKGLRDVVTKAPTTKAIEDGFAKFTPMKDGRNFYMWNRSKIGHLLREQGLEVATPVEVETCRVFSEIRRFLNTKWKNDKIARLAWDALGPVFEDYMENVDHGIKGAVRKKAIARLVAENIIESDTLTY